MGYWILKAILTPLVRFAYRVRTDGCEHIPRKGGAVLAANHNSFMDSIFIPLVIRRRVTFLAKAEYFDSRRTAWFFRMGGQIPIKREGGSASRRALETACEVLNDQNLLAIYPEGTRSPDGRLYRGHTGVARMAITCGVPIVPIGLTGTREVQPSGSMRPRLFRTVHIRVGAPIYPEGPAGPDSPVLAHPAELRRYTDQVLDAIAELSGQERCSAYAKRHHSPEPMIELRHVASVPAEGEGSATAGGSAAALT